MKVINIIGRILGALSSIFIILSLFVSTVEIKALNISIYSMSLFDYNRIGSSIIIVTALICLATIYFGKGLLTSILSVVIIVADFYTAITLNTRSTVID